MKNWPEVLREYRAKIVPASAVGSVDIKSLGTRTKFGGVPDEIQSGGQANITGPGCRKKMSFIGQIDSFEFNGQENPNRKDYRDTQFMFGDVGIIYVCFCFDCLEPLATMDCY
jgi:hypothetical protein